jgi:hypothetical protein
LTAEVTLSDALSCAAGGGRVRQASQLQPIEAWGARSRRFGI